MEYDGISDSVLDQVLGDMWGGPYTLRDLLKSVKNSINAHILKTDDKGQLLSFIAWTDRDVLVLLDGPMGDKDVCSFPRNPP